MVCTEISAAVLALMSMFSHQSLIPRDDDPTDAVVPLVREFFEMLGDGEAGRQHIIILFWFD